MLLHEGKELSF